MNKIAATSFCGLEISLAIFWLFILISQAFLGGGISDVSHFLLSAFLLGFGVLLISQKLQMNKHMAFFGFFMLCACLSFFFSKTPNVGFNELLKISATALSFISIALIARHKQALELVMKWLFIFVISSLLFGFFVYVNFPFSRFTGFFTSFSFGSGFYPNVWADFLIIAFLPLVFVNTFIWRNFLLKILSYSLFFAAFFLSYSRGAWIAFLCGAFAFLTILIWRRAFVYKLLEKKKSNLRNLFILVFTIFLLSIALIFSANLAREQAGFKLENLREKALFQADEANISVNERKIFWQKSIDLLPETPVFGFGPYSFPTIYSTVQSELLVFADHPHNLFLKIALENGFFALICLILFYIYTAYCSISRLSKTNDFVEFMLQTLAICILAAFLAHQMIDYNLNFISIAWFYGLPIGLIVNSKSNQTKNTAKISTVIFLVLALIPASLKISDVRFFESANFVRQDLPEQKFLRAEDFFSTELPNLKLAKYDAKTLEHYENASKMWESKNYPEILVNKLYQSGDFNEALKKAEYFGEKLPLNSEIQYLQGKIYLALGENKSAQKYFQKALHLNPKNQIKYHYALLLALNQKETKTEKAAAYDIAKQYLKLLKVNFHFTVLSDNAFYASKIAEFVGDQMLFTQIRETYLLEASKM
jgi:O-antigen ligase